MLYKNANAKYGILELLIVYTILDDTSGVLEKFCNKSQLSDTLAGLGNAQVHSVTPVVVTAAMEDRLEHVNKQKMDGRYLNELSNFVRYGFIHPTAVGSFLKDDRDDYLVETKEYLLKLHKDILAKHRHQVEVGGITHGTHQVHTDREAQSAIATTVASFQNGMLESIDYKFKNGWGTFNKAEFLKLALAVQSHVTEVFSIEKSVAEDLAELTPAELCEMKHIEDLDSPLTGAVKEVYKVDVVELFQDYIR